MIIATSITADYLERSQPLFTSVLQYAPNERRLCFTIGFTATIEGWECIEAQYSECTWQPKNRPSFHTLQHGEFVKYLPEDVEPDEMLLFVDSDTELQRPWDLNFPSMRGIMVTACSWPMLPLREVVRNLKGKSGTVRKYDIKKQYTEFCGCFILATVARWEDIYRASRGLYDLLDNFTHHAAWQLLVNLAVLRNFRAFLLPPHICNATWYEGTGMMKDGSIFVERKGVVGAAGKIGDELIAEQVYFKHTKFE